MPRPQSRSRAFITAIGAFFSVGTKVLRCGKGYAHQRVRNRHGFRRHELDRRSGRQIDLRPAGRCRLHGVRGDERARSGPCRLKSFIFRSQPEQRALRPDSRRRFCRTARPNCLSFPISVRHARGYGAAHTGSGNGRRRKVRAGVWRRIHNPRDRNAVDRELDRLRHRNRPHMVRRVLFRKTAISTGFSPSIRPRRSRSTAISQALFL